MAINFTVSYTFSPSTTISSSQVNTNFSDEANVWNGLEAETKSFAKLKVDIDPTLALEVATKQYVDHYSTYRRPNLQWASTTAVNMEAGINGTSGQAQILFPDGNLRTDSTTSRINLDITRTAAFSGTAQSGMDTGSVSVNNWLAIYAVKTIDNTSNFVITSSLLAPTQANYATLNSRFGSSTSWVYLGLIRYGDQGSTNNVILRFVQNGHITLFYNSGTGGNILNTCGVLEASTASATTLDYTYGGGMTGSAIPVNIGNVFWLAAGNNMTNLRLAGGGVVVITTVAGSQSSFVCLPATVGLRVVNSGANSADIWLSGFVDGTLGVGANPLL